MGAHSLSPCIRFGPLVGLRRSAWEGKCALFLCIGHGARRRIGMHMMKLTCDNAVQLIELRTLHAGRVYPVLDTG